MVPTVQDMKFLEKMLPAYPFLLPPLDRNATADGN
jgi:hypothetical protein